MTMRGPAAAGEPPKVECSSAGREHYLHIWTMRHNEWTEVVVGQCATCHFLQALEVRHV